MNAATTIIISVRVKPRSSISAIEHQGGENWVARLHSAPVDGKANAELVELVARQFGCAKSRIEIVSGASARIKRLRIRA